MSPRSGQLSSSSPLHAGLFSSVSADVSPEWQRRWADYRQGAGQHQLNGRGQQHPLWGWPDVIGVRLEWRTTDARNDWRLHVTADSMEALIAFQDQVMKSPWAGRPAAAASSAGGAAGRVLNVPPYPPAMPGQLAPPAFAGGGVHPMPGFSPSAQPVPMGGLSADPPALSPRRLRRLAQESSLPYRFCCPDCSFKSRRRSHLDKHRKQHATGQTVLECLKCDFRCLRQGDLARHSLAHADTVYRCEQMGCRFQTHSRQQLSKHVRYKHVAVKREGELPTTVFSCDQCEYQTTKAPFFQRHQKKHVGKPASSAAAAAAAAVAATIAAAGDKAPATPKCRKQLSSCPHCPYTTAKTNNLTRHVATVHSMARKFLCSHCGIGYKRRDTLKQHMRLHLKGQQMSGATLDSPDNSGGEGERSSAAGSKSRRKNSKDGDKSARGDSCAPQQRVSDTCAQQQQQLQQQQQHGQVLYTFDLGCTNVLTEGASFLSAEHLSTLGPPGNTGLADSRTKI